MRSRVKLSKLVNYPCHMRSPESMMRIYLGVVAVLTHQTLPSAVAMMPPRGCKIVTQIRREGVSWKRNRRPSSATASNRATVAAMSLAIDLRELDYLRAKRRGGRVEMNPPDRVDRSDQLE